VPFGRRDSWIARPNVALGKADEAGSLASGRHSRNRDLKNDLQRSVGCKRDELGKAQISSNAVGKNVAT
jgi:hypothetical protein